MEDMINMADIQKIMDESGPVVNTVLIQPPTAEGQKESIEQIELDMTPSKNKIVELMGGSVTILGQYNDIETVVLKLRNPGEEATENPHKLQPPLHSQTVFGPMLLVRMDESANPQNFAKVRSVCLRDMKRRNESGCMIGHLISYSIMLQEEYMEFLKKDIEPFEISEQPVGGANEEEEYEEEEDEEVDDEEGEGEGDEDDDSDGEDDENEMVHMMIMNAVMEKFKGQYGRDPTEKEVGSTALKAPFRLSNFKVMDFHVCS